MINALGQLVGWIGAHALESIGVFVIAVGIATVSVWVDRKVTGREAPESDSMRVEMVHRTMEVGDLQEPTEPEVVKVYEAPDSQDTRQDCITVPSWLPSPHITEQSGVKGSQMPSARPETGALDTARTTAKFPAERSPPALAGLPYVITPTTNGRPSLSVGSRRVTLSAIDPRNGAGLEYEWRVQQPTWAVWPEIEMQTTPSGLQASASGALRWRDWTLTAGYTVMQDARGWSAGLRWRPFQIKW